MDFLQLVQARQSDRSYDKQRPVEPEKLERILEAARLAPSACNAQPWKFVVITDKELAQKAGKAAAGLGMNKFAKDAPVHILVVEESANITSLLGGKVKGKHFPLIDIGIVAAHIALAAEAEGLGSCILGWFDEKEMKQLAGIPASKRLLLDIVIGYPAKEKLRELESHMLEYKVQVSDLKRQLQEKDADTQNQLKQAQMEADLKLERAVIAKERELQEELRTSDRENVRLQTELEQLRASLAPNQDQTIKE